MIKCSFCEQALVCKFCGHAVHPRKGEVHVGLYQPDMEVSCPECKKLLVCKVCGFAYGEEESNREP